MDNVPSIFSEHLGRVRPTTTMATEGRSEAKIIDLNEKRTEGEGEAGQGNHGSDRSDHGGTGLFSQLGLGFDLEPSSDEKDGEDEVQGDYQMDWAGGDSVCEESAAVLTFVDNNVGLVAAARKRQSRALKPLHFNAILGMHLDSSISAMNRENMNPETLEKTRYPGLGSDALIPPLEEVAPAAAVPTNRPPVAFALGTGSVGVSIPPLVEDSTNRPSLALALGTGGVGASIPPLVEVAASRAVPRNRHSLALALGRKGKEGVDDMSRKVEVYMANGNMDREADEMSKLKLTKSNMKKKTPKGTAKKKQGKAKKKAGAKAKSKKKAATIKKTMRKEGSGIVLVTMNLEVAATAELGDNQEDGGAVGRGKEAVEEEEVGEEVEGEVAPTNDLESDDISESPAVSELKACTVAPTNDLESDDISESPAVSELKACTVVGAKCDIGVAQYYQLEGTMLRHYRATWLSNMVCRKCGKGAWSGKTSVYCCRDGFDRDGMTCDGVCCQGCKDKLILALAEKGRTGSKRKRKVPEHLK
jgi:hypothetical protein